MSEQIEFGEILKNAKRNCYFNLKDVRKAIIENAIWFWAKKTENESSNAFYKSNQLHSRIRSH